MFRMAWLAALVFATLAYMLSGLSQRSEQAAENLPVENASLERASMPVETAPEGVFEEISQESSIVQALDQARRERLKQLELESAEMADWMAVSRRLSLALVGTGLSLQEIRSLQTLPENERVPAHLKRLLDDSRFHDYWSERWTRFLVGANEGPFLVYRRRRFRLWLSEQFAQNRPYDQMVRDLITAEGLWTDRPEVNFYTVTYDSGDDGPDPIRLAARTSRVFLGLRIDCLQCHDDFLGNVSLGDLDATREGMQSDFHQLAAFFSSAKSNGLQGVRNGEVDYRYKYLHAEEEVTVEPAVPYQSELLPQSGDARERLADWITSPNNRQAARSAVHHVWALLFGRARGESVDNLPLDQEPDPEMEILISDFIEHDYDIRRLIRLIVSSESFRVSSRADFHITTRHDLAGAVFPLVRLRPEQIAGAVIQSARIKTVDRDSSFVVQLQKFGSTNDFIRRYGDMGEDEFVTDNLTISQRLVMLNGDLVDESVDDNPFLNATSHVRMFSEGDETTVRNAYLCVLNRYPSMEEAVHFGQRIEEADQRAEAVEDLFWTLLNSSEFAWNH